MNEVNVGDRYTYTTPDNRTVHYQVVRLDTAVNGTADAWCVECALIRLEADEPGWLPVQMASAGLASSYGWARDEES
jgi:hypothetical protein